MEQELFIKVVMVVVIALLIVPPAIIAVLDLRKRPKSGWCNFYARMTDENKDCRMYMNTSGRTASGTDERFNCKDCISYSTKRMPGEHKNRRCP